MRSRASVVIPARLGSRRFPRKVLARDTGKFLIQHVWERVVGCPGIERVIVATDSEEVLQAARQFGAEVQLTSTNHVSGTDRVAEVAASLEEPIIINVQGDEPLIAHDDLSALLMLFECDSEAVMTTLAVRRTDSEGFVDPNVVKVVWQQQLGAEGVGCSSGAPHGRALYFSRAAVPCVRLLSETQAARWGRGESTRQACSSGGTEDTVEWWQHIGIYGYRRDFLLRFASLAPTYLEKRERLEQLRALEHGYVIRVTESKGRHFGIDTEEEYRRFVEEFRRAPAASDCGAPAVGGHKGASEAPGSIPGVPG